MRTFPGLSHLVFLLVGAILPVSVSAQSNVRIDSILRDLANGRTPSFSFLKAWEPAPDGPWEARRGHETVVLGGNVWLYGGLNFREVVPPVGTVFNDVWYTPDGNTWTRAIEHAAWPPRLSFGTASYDNKMWVLGGDDGAASLSDVYSSSDGVNWALVASSAAWGKRDGHEVLVYDGLLWVLGGNTAGKFLNDVWYSANGKDWVRAVEHAAWTERAYFASAVFKDQMWVFGGAVENTTVRDVWSSSDGVAWTQSTSTAPWSGRSGHAVAVLNDRLWLTGGGGSTAAAGSKEVWYSDDGLNWYAGEAPAWAGVLSHASLAFNNELYLFGGGSYAGSNTNGVWAYAPATGPGMGCGAGTLLERGGIPFGDLLPLTAVMLILAACARAVFIIKRPE